MTPENRTAAMRDLALVALGACMGAPDLVKTIAPSDLHFPEIIAIVEAMKSKPREEVLSLLTEWMDLRGVEVNGGALTSALEHLAAYARHESEMREHRRKLIEGMLRRVKQPATHEQQSQSGVPRQ